MKKLQHFIICLFVFTILLVLSCQKELYCETCNANKPPVAIAGADQLILLPADTTLLNGSASYDPGGAIVSYQWAQFSGPSVSIITNNVSSITSVKSLLPGVYQFELTVANVAGLQAKDTVLLLVNDPGTNLPPIARAGADQTITLPLDSVLLDGSFSVDPDGSITSYEWKKISGSATCRISNPLLVQAKADQLVQGVYRFELSVTDNGGLSGKDTVSIHVNPAAGNMAPIARPGNDTSINFDLRTCTIPASFRLNGRQSSDPDGTIVSYHWAGWRPGTVVRPDSAVTEVKDLQMGVNKFYLTVTDNRGSVHREEVAIKVISMMNRPTVLAQLVYVGELSERKTGVATAAAGNKILFAGGWPLNATSPASSRVDIFNVVTGQWSIAQLSEGRVSPGSAALGNKIFFAGGGITKPNTAGNYEYSNSSTSTSATVDIYDVATGSWTTSQLSSRHAPTGAAAGSRVVFAGGDGLNPSNVADVFNEGTNSWSSFTLSASRHISQATTQSGKIYFGGGSRDFMSWGGPVYNNVDVYDASANTWTVDMLSKGRGLGAAIAANNRIRWGGGFVNSGYFDETHTVETINLNDNSTTAECFCEEKGNVTAVRRNDFVVFFGGHSKNKFDILDIQTNTWAIGLLPANVQTNSGSIISHNDKLYVFNLTINGGLTNQVFRLDF